MASNSKNEWSRPESQMDSFDDSFFVVVVAVIIVTPVPVSDNPLKDILVRVCIPPQTIITKKKFGEEKTYSMYTSTLLFITEGSQTGQELGGRN